MSVHNTFAENIEDPFNTDSHEDEAAQHQNNIINSLQNLVIHDTHPSNTTGNIYDPSMDVSRLSNVSLVDDSNKSIDKVDDSNKSIDKVDDSNKSIDKDDLVYLTNIYQTISKLNKKVNTLIKNKFVHKNVLTSLYKKIKKGDKEQAEHDIETVLHKRDIRRVNTNLLVEYIKSNVSPQMTDVVDNFGELENIVKEIYKIAKSGLTNLELSQHQLLDLTEEHNKKMKAFVSKYNILNVSNKIDLSYQTEEDVYREVINTLSLLQTQIKTAEDESNKIKNDTDIKDLQNQIFDKKQAIRQLQAQNVSFSETITRLDTANIKLKKECIILSNEYKKIEGSLKSKNRIIDKQKNIIDVLQKQLYGKQSPLSELMSKMNKLKLRINNEDDADVREQYKKEIDDCERRIKDFEKVSKQNDR